MFTLSSFSWSSHCSSWPNIGAEQVSLLWEHAHVCDGGVEIGCYVFKNKDVSKQKFVSDATAAGCWCKVNIIVQ